MSDRDIHPATLLANQVLQDKLALPLPVPSYATFKDLPDDDSARAMIRLAFDASLLTDESRYPSVRMLCHRAEPNIRFPEAVPLPDAEAVRRLAPAARRRGSALAIRATAPDAIFCHGVYEHADVLPSVQGLNYATAWESQIDSMRDSLFAVGIEGPGRVRAGFRPGQAWLLSGGRVRPRRSWIEIDEAYNVVNAVTQNYLDALPSDNELIRRWVKNEPEETLWVLTRWLGHLLMATADEGHGGAFVVRLDEGDANVEGGTAVAVSLRDLYCRAIEEAVADCDGDSIVPFVHAWALRRPRLFKLAEQIAGLSAVDGCVVLDGGLSLQRFGAKLRFAGGLALPSDLEGTGTRHVSAYRFCCENPAAAFVVSQDGHLTIMCHVRPGTASVHRDEDPGTAWVQR